MEGSSKWYCGVLLGERPQQLFEHVIGHVLGPDGVGSLTASLPVDRRRYVVETDEPHLTAQREAGVLEHRGTHMLHHRADVGGGGAIGGAIRN